MLWNQKLHIKDLMQRILTQNLKKKNKLMLSMNWMTKDGALNFIQKGKPEEIIIFKSKSKLRFLGDDKFKLNTEILSKIDSVQQQSNSIEVNNNVLQTLNEINSKKIRDSEYDKLLHKIINRNSLMKHNNKYVLDQAQNTNGKNMMADIVANGVKQTIVQNGIG